MVEYNDPIIVDAVSAKQANRRLSHEATFLRALPPYPHLLHPFPAKIYPIYKKCEENHIPIFLSFGGLVGPLVEYNDEYMRLLSYIHRRLALWLRKNPVPNKYFYF